MSGFAAAVNDLGGVTINNPAPVRDAYSGLDLPRTGSVHLDGVEALALVRSRFPQTLTSSGWVAASTAVGDSDRTRWVGSLFRELAAKAHAARDHPVELQGLAWDLTGSLTLDHGTGLTDLFGLNLGGARVVDLSVKDLSADGVGASPDPATYQTLASAGFTKSCREG